MNEPPRSSNDGLEETMIFEAEQKIGDEKTIPIVRQSDSSTEFQNEKSQSLEDRRVQLLKGSHGKLTEEIDRVTLSRLQIASLLLFFGNLVFLLYRIIWPNHEDSMPLAGTVFWAHIVMTAVTGLVGLRSSVGMKAQDSRSSFGNKIENLKETVLADKKPQCRFLSSARLTGWHLRISELLVFGGSAIFFFLFTVSTLLGTAELGYVAMVNGPWMLLIFTYALFIPNDWRRAARVIIPMSFGPVGAMTITWFASPSFREAVENPFFSDSFATVFLSMGFAAAIAIHGVRTIRSLRTEAFQAKQLGQYRLTRLIGGGGMGNVYEAEHLLLKRTCAIKVIKPDQAGNDKVLERFEREVRSTAKLRHWNTVDIYDYGRADDGTFYYVMELLPGSNLQELVEESGPISQSRVIRLLIQVCEALGEAHQSGLVHRDIKPANIFLTDVGEVKDVIKLLDFGLVLPIVEKNDSHELTGQNTIVGSPLYMPPEQASGTEADTRSDIYSLGAVAYFLIEGNPPFSGNSPLDVILAHSTKTPPSLNQDSASPEFNDIVLKCLAKNPSDRFQSVKELAENLRNCYESLSENRILHQ